MGLMQSTSPSNKRDLPLDVQKLRELLWYPFFTAADSLLEMMNYIYWDAKEKNKKEKVVNILLLPALNELFITIIITLNFLSTLG